MLPQNHIPIQDVSKINFLLQHRVFPNIVSEYILSQIVASFGLGHYVFPSTNFTRS